MTSPFRLGIWCDYETHTYAPSGSAFASLDHLVTGLLEAGVEVALLVCPGDQRHARRFSAFGHPRLYVFPKRSSLLRRLFSRFRLAARLVRWLHSVLLHGPTDAVWFPPPWRGRVRVGGGEASEGSSPPPPPSPARGEGERVPSPLAGEGELVPSPARGEGENQTTATGSRIRTRHSVLLIPLTILIRVVRKVHALGVCRQHAPPYPHAVDAHCQAWLIPDAALPWRVPFPAVAMIQGTDLEAGRAAEAMLCVWTEAATAEPLPWLDPTRLRLLRSEDARAWLRVLQEAEPLWHWEAALDKRPDAGWSRVERLPAEPRRQLGTFLFLPTRCLTGVWETTKEILHDLAAINRERGRLNLTLGLHETQEDTPGDRGRVEDLLPVQRLRLSPITRTEAVGLLGESPHWLQQRREHRFLFPHGATEQALRADAWLALVDRFPLPLLPARPYGVMVYDTIWRHLPESYPATFAYDLERGLKPTLQAAELVVATSPPTREDVIAGYEVERDRVRLVPVACAPHRRFGTLTPRAVPLPDGPLVLNPTNCTPHKGAEVLLRGHALLKQRLGRKAPRLVLCGYGVRYFRAGTPLVPTSPPHQERVQRLVAQLGLREGEDVIFLDYVSDAELAWLYRRCAVVVNAALYDNGSFNLTEASYFGRPAVSSRYPAAEYLCERFGIATHFFAPNDPEELANAIRAALAEPSLPEAELTQRRARFLEPEYSSRRFAERLYELLVELAERGRAAQGRPRQVA